jgi:hypothetical protein
MGVDINLYVQQCNSTFVPVVKELVYFFMVFIPVLKITGLPKAAICSSKG